MSDPALLTVDDLRVDFATRRGTVHAVRGASYVVSAGESLGLVGESGSGKSVSALAVLGLLPSSTARISGSVRIRDEELVGAPEKSLRAIRGSSIALIFQDPLSSLNPLIPLGKQITEQLDAHGRGRAGRERALELLAGVGISDPVRRMKQYPHELSGGMRQRVMIAMALSCEPELLIADEPTTALDVTIQAQIIELLQELRERLGMSLLLITHDLGVAAGSTDRLAVMYAGRIVETGGTAEVLAAPAHPYTVGLLSSVPRLDRPRESALSPIAGGPPDLGGTITGCPFAPRCPHVQATCSDDPPLHEIAGGHQVACWFPRGGRS